MIKNYSKKEVKELTKQSQAMIHKKDYAALEKAIMEWDFSGLNEIQRLTYLKSICKESGLNFKLNPFAYIRFEGKVIPYLKGAGAAQLRSINNLSSKITARTYDKETGIYTVTVEVFDKKGRGDEDSGSVCITGLRGKDLANAYMKAATKAKRRATLSITGMLQFDNPIGDDDPIRQTRNEERLEDVTERTETEARPVFEEQAAAEPPAVESAAAEPNPGVGEDHPPAPPTPEGYVMRGGKNKGKLLKDLSKNHLKKLVTLVDQLLADGKAVHPDVQDDAFHARAELDAEQLTLGEA